MDIRHDIETQHLNTKIKLLQDTLTKRNQDFDFAEDNNRQLLSLLEKYDNKLDELQEDLELRDLKIIEYEKDITDSTDKIKIESLEDKIKFITQMLDKLREMHNNQRQEAIQMNKRSVIQAPALDDSPPNQPVID